VEAIIGLKSYFKPYVLDPEFRQNVDEGNFA
jgi:hypothetical protein